MRRVLTAVAVVAAMTLAACGGDNKVGSGVDVNNLGDVVEGQRLGARTTTTQAAVSTTVPAGRQGVGEQTTTTRPPTTLPPTTAPPRVTTFDIVINADTVGTQFEPSHARVYVGSVVKWTNKDEVPRSVEATSGAFDSGMLAPGASYTYKADKAGSFDYADGTRPYAVGKLEVLPR